MSYTALVDAYETERPRYEALARVIGEMLQEALTSRGVESIVIWRAKETLSFVKKALRKGYTDPMVEVGDKAGVRVIVYFIEHIPVVEEIAKELCDVQGREQKLNALAYNELGYLGVHLQVRPKEKLAASIGDDLGGLQAELQIHTMAQSAWAVVSHRLLYKTAVELPDPIKRSVMRLVALVEFFDAEVERFGQEIKLNPDFKDMAVISDLDDLILQYTSVLPDRALSALSIPELVPLYGVEPERVVPDSIAPFLQNNAAKLEELYERYRGDSRANPLLFQPEALLIFERLDNDPDHLVEAWPREILPPELLEGLATIWGSDVEVIPS
jgi:putative GTP pyrophosphokinase